MLPDTPENLMQIIIYKAYAVPMDFYWRNLLYIAERVFLDPFPFFKYFIPKVDLHNHYAGDDADLRIWRGALPSELLEFMERVKPSKCPSCCTTGCMTESTWSLLKNVCGRCSGTAETWAGAIDSIWTVMNTKQTQTGRLRLTSSTIP